jgi:hypothetical protein
VIYLIHLYGTIEGISYEYKFLLPNLNTYDDLSKGIRNASYFIYNKNDEKFAVSWWVSPKRTRSYPYTRIYNTLQFKEGKIVTIIPVIKDEGYDGDRDFIQWDTVSLMSLLHVYVIVGYYEKAQKNPKFQNKITNQEFDYRYLEKKFDELSKYRSDSLHWNINEISNIKQLAEKAVYSYEKISDELKIKMHNHESALKRIEKVMKDAITFRDYSRQSSKNAQYREGATIQPKEMIYGRKAIIDIENYLGGIYHFTVDEVFLNFEASKMCLVEAKHSIFSPLPKEEDIKDGLLKMVLYTNLKDLYYDSEKQNKVKINQIKPILRLTNVGTKLTNEDYKLLKSLIEEANANHFEILINEKKVNALVNDIPELIDFKC